MLEGLPKDPMMLLSVINTKLRDNYANWRGLIIHMMMIETSLYKEEYMQKTSSYK